MSDSLLRTEPQSVSATPVKSARHSIARQARHNFGDQQVQTLTTTSPVRHDWVFSTKGHAMDRLKAIENHVAGATERGSSVYVPPLQLTQGQPPPIAANGGLSYMSFDRDGDAGTAAATEAALHQIAEGEGHAVIDTAGRVTAARDETLSQVLRRALREYVKVNASGCRHIRDCSTREMPREARDRLRFRWLDPSRAVKSCRHSIHRERVVRNSRDTGDAMAGRTIPDSGRDCSCRFLEPGSQSTRPQPGWHPVTSNIC